MSPLATIQSMLTIYPDGKVIFEEKLRVKLTPHQQAFDVYGAWRSPEGPYLMDAAGEWHGPLKEIDRNAGLLITSLYQRLKMLQLQCQHT